MFSLSNRSTQSHAPVNALDFELRNDANHSSRILRVEPKASQRPLRDGGDGSLFESVAAETFHAEPAPELLQSVLGIPGGKPLLERALALFADIAKAFVDGSRGDTGLAADPTAVSEKEAANAGASSGLDARPPQSEGAAATAATEPQQTQGENANAAGRNGDVVSVSVVVAADLGQRLV